MIVMGREHIAAVVALPFHFRNDIEESVVFQEAVFYVDPDGFHTFHGLRGHPDDRLVDHVIAIGLVELDGRRPGLDKARIGAPAFRLQFGKHLAVPVREPEIAADQAIRVLGFCQVGEEALRSEVQGIHVIDRELAAHPRRILSHGEIHARREFLAIRPEFHLSGKGVDVDGERLERDRVGTGFDKLLLQILSCLVRAALGVAASLKPGRTEFLHDPLVKRQVLRLHLHGTDHEQYPNQPFHTGDCYGLKYDSIREATSSGRSIKSCPWFIPGKTSTRASGQRLTRCLAWGFATNASFVPYQ